MSLFLRLLEEADKPELLATSCQKVRNGQIENKIYEVDSEAFNPVPGKPFAYWVSDKVRNCFDLYSKFESENKTARQGLATADDFRFLRLHWEVNNYNEKWLTFTKGGNFSRYYDPLYLVGNWKENGKELRGFSGSVIRNPSYYKSEGLTWPLRSHSFCPQVLPSGTVITTRGSGIYSDDPLLYLALFSSKAIDLFLRLLSGREGHPQYDMGDVSLLPIPEMSDDTKSGFRELAQLGWSLKRKLDSVQETGRAFMLPVALRNRLERFNHEAIFEELERIQIQIDDMAFDLYEFAQEDRQIALRTTSIGEENLSGEPVISEKGDQENQYFGSANDTLSWAVGCSFGRFDWRLATGEREAPPEPEPFDPLPAKSPGMLPDGAEPFHHHAGILVDDEGHQHDLPRLIEQVLETVDASVSLDIRRWLRRDFFPFHLQQYSKSRRKAPIYWPLSTTSGSYTLWLYYPELTSQTLFTAVNDFVEPKLNSVRDDLNSLRTKGGSRSKQEEKELETLENLEQELADLRDTLLEIAPGYRPNQDDGVQITAAPLWSFFRHKPWQKVLKDTWSKLEKGDYDWAHMALNCWPDRVLHKCHEDRSLAIAHDVEGEFWEEVEVPVIRRGKDTGETKLEWQPKNLSEAPLQVLINQIRQERSL